MKTMCLLALFGLMTNLSYASQACEDEAVKLATAILRIQEGDETIVAKVIQANVMPEYEGGVFAIYDLKGHSKSSGVLRELPLTYSRLVMVQYHSQCTLLTYTLPEAN